MATVTSIESAQQQVLTAASNQLSGGICLDNVKTSTPTLVDDAVVKPRTTLPAKYNKFLQFGFYLMKKINSDDENQVIDETLFLDKLRIFDTIDSQQSFVQEFIDSSKAINQTLRKMVQVHKKNIIKAAKVKAPRVKKVKEPKLPKEKKEKKNAKQKKNVAGEEDVLVDELVRLAQSGEPTQGTYGSPETPPLAEVVTNVVTDVVPDVVSEVVIEVKKEKKVKEAKPAKEPKVAKEPKPVKEAKPVKEPKPAKEAKPAKEPKVAKKVVKESSVEAIVENKVEASVDDDEEEDLDVSPYIHNNVKYLIDDAKNIYHFDTHQFISTLQQLLREPTVPLKPLP
jgi:hypothetical protein